MKLFFVVFVLFYIYSCTERARDPQQQPGLALDNTPDKSYDAIKDSIAIYRKRLSLKYPSLAALHSKQSEEEITDFWVNNVGNTLFRQWQNTPWDYNGTADRPNHGAIACGYFVTTILRDMDMKIKRSKLAVCASSVMMKTLTPHQKLKNLSYLDYDDFNTVLEQSGKGVYIIGLDFHTGFIVNDGKENWFIHSLFLQRKGVVKEKLLTSWGLRSSKTRWLISLTGDKEFIYGWLKR